MESNIENNNINQDLQNKFPIENFLKEKVKRTKEKEN